MKPSFMQKKFARRTFFQSLFFSIILFVIAASFHWRSQDMGTPLDVKDYVPLCIFVLLYGILQWMFQKNTLFKLMAGQTEAVPVKTRKAAPTPPPDKIEPDRTMPKNREKRLFIHLFAMLQRDGRLLDFLHEDLTLYQDAQIGAAVRGIHENCRKTVDRYLSPIPVMQQAEGETVKIASGFDRHAIKLVGKVVGQPPFTGVLRHRGWQLRSLSLPELADTENPNVIAPAEVEIQ